ncbi:TlpA family protein disulfide reductase [Sphingobacterium faecium]|uniref:TlpA family protein disulfide reductase n=1 Tax=Sphingobacterium faecium TaxID=34087 RepID=UPI002468AE8E|nr:redoxin domain-containing protein [Sphingobacterium faecium]MDH5825821.1 redoxin domain-containing protein [Sphingobacterium faecium]
MKLTTLICFLVFITSISQAQEKDKYGRPPLVPGIAELKIGDQVPDILIDNIINNDKRSIRTSDYKDKLLVLDFWDTTCSTCIASMPKLDSLQRVFGDKIKLLSVTYQAEDMITKFFKANRFLNERTPPVHRASVVDDRALRSYFRYETNPHVVWIYKGKVVAITGPDYMNGKNIQTLLDGKPVDWLLKTEQFDTTIPFVSLNPLWQDGADSPDFGYSVLTGQATSVPSLGGINYIQDKVHNQSRIAIYNQSIFTTYQMLLYNTKPDEITYGLHPARVALEVKNPSRYFYKEEFGEQIDWNRKNLLNYEMVKSGTVEETEMAKLAIQDLNTRLKIHGRYEKRKVNCLVFVKTDKPITDTLAQESEGKSIEGLIIMRLDGVQKYPPAINETGFDGGLRMEPDDGTIAGLRKEMQRHGLDLIEAEREIEVMVISDAK